MNEYDKKYDSFKINRHKAESEGLPAETTEKKRGEISPDEDFFYEMEYGAEPFSEREEVVSQSQKIEAPPKDEVRELFNKMRDIARKRRSYYYNSSKFYDKRVQQENSRIFYEQGMFMKDFEDDYPKKVEYSSYFPYYQMMGYEQLRTYFTWRTKVRKGEVAGTSLSYAYLYLYELLCNIGVESPEDGLEKLLFFWREFRKTDRSIDKYVIKWLKDYHIYYELPESFLEFVVRNDLGKYYPEVRNSGDDFEVFCTISKYDIRKSAFYNEENKTLIQNCFYSIMDRIRTVLAKRQISLDEAIFQPVKNKTTWEPFKQALFWPWMPQRDRRMVLSEKEVYVCSQNHWTFSKVITTESGKQLVGYILKQMEAVLRKMKNYKYKLSADISMVHHTIMTFLEVEEIDLEKVVTDAVMEFYREVTKTVVIVNSESLKRIREEAWQTQEKLIVPEEEEVWWESDIQIEGELRQETEEKPALGEDDPWRKLRTTLSTVELEALRILLNGTGNIKHFADQQGVMLEVLMDSINEKATDLVGDSLMDEEFILYEDYIEQVKEMVEGK